MRTPHRAELIAEVYSHKDGEGWGDAVGDKAGGIIDREIAEVIVLVSRLHTYIIMVYL